MISDIEVGSVCLYHFFLLNSSPPFFSDDSSYSLINATSPAINYVSCPSFLFTLIQCNFSTTDEGSCVDQNVKSNIFITCRKGKPHSQIC